MPTTSSLDFDQILNVLINSKVDIFDKETKKLRSPNHLCWNELKKTNQLQYLSKILIFNFKIKST
jgi:hypothetical protein